MEQLEILIQQKEIAFIATVESIISQHGSNRTKMAIIHRQYIKCLVAIDDLVGQAKLQTPPAVEVSA